MTSEVEVEVLVDPNTALVSRYSTSVPLLSSRRERHQCHWSEVFFFLTLLMGVVEVVNDQLLPLFTMPPTVALICYTVTSGVACGLLWNLVSIKRIAAAIDLLVRDVRRFEGENIKARALQRRLKGQSERMKDSLADMKMAQLLLRGSCDGLEAVVQQEEQMRGERDALMGKRREINGKLLKTMEKMWDTTIDQIRLEVTERATMVFDTVARRDGKGEHVVVVDSKEFELLDRLLDEYGVDTDKCKLDSIDSGMERLKRAAGQDGVLTWEEFHDWLDEELQDHFEEIKRALKRIEAMKDDRTEHVLQSCLPSADIFTR